MNHLESHVTERTFEKSAMIKISLSLGWQMWADGVQGVWDSRRVEAHEQ